MIADAPAALAAPHTGTAETLPAAGGSRTIWSDAGGRIFSRTWDGAAHGAWTEQPNQGAFLSVTSALTTTDAAQQTDINALKVETAPQALGRGDNAVIVTISGVPTMTQNPQGETRLRLDRETLEWLSDEMPGGGGGGSASPGSPDLLGGTDGWSVWQDETGLLTFTAVLDPYEYPREYVALPNGELFINGASPVPLRIVYGDGLGLAPASMAPVRRTQIVTLDDQGGQDGLNGMEAVAPAVGITATGAGFAALSADMFLADAVGPAKWVGVRSEAVVGATLPELTSGQGWLNVLRARDQFVQQLAAYDRIGQFDAVTIMHGAGSDSATYAADLRALVTKLGEAGARQVNVMVPCGTSQRGDFASTLATIEAFRDRGVAPMRLVAPLYAFPRSGLVNPTPEAVTMLAELDALCAADPSWLPPMAFLARRTGNIIDVDFEVMAGFSLLPSGPVTLGLTYSGAAITTAGVVADPLTGLMTRLRITLATAAAGTLRYAFGPAAAEGNMRDNWSVMSRTDQPLYRHALPFQFEVS